MTDKIVIPGELPDMNTIVEYSKQHWAKYSEMKREHTEKVAWIAKTELEPMQKVDLYFIWYCRNRRKDKDNIIVGQKYIIDGLVEAGILANDGWKQIGNIAHEFEVDKDNPRVEVEISEAV
jgi:Holliday junction resolvase RusA-like endonuclease